MKLQFDDSYLTCDHHQCAGINKKSKNYETFIKGYKKLTNEELLDTLCVPTSQIKEYILHCVPCIGCRTRFDEEFFFLLSNKFYLFF
jgi:predicted nucleic acid binding AN1-type Zn finger protein